MQQVVIGTAGHIDHGKTALVKALTGIDTDTLLQEKNRGITIDLGFAYLNEKITIVDVPGHQKFIRNMVAGASTIHLGLLVVAADDGVMPQTLEHLHILDSLAIINGIIVITKIDTVDDEWIEMVIQDVEKIKSNYTENTRFYDVMNSPVDEFKSLEEEFAQFNDYMEVFELVNIRESGYPDVLDYEGNGAVVISWWEMTLRNKKSGKTNTIMQHIQHSFNEKGEIVREDYYFNPAQLPK